MNSHCECELDLNCPFVILLEDIEAQCEFMTDEKDFITIENLEKIEEHAHSYSHFTDFKNQFRRSRRERLDHHKLDHVMERSRICVDMLRSEQSTVTQYMDNHLQTKGQNIN